MSLLQSNTPINIDLFDNQDIDLYISTYNTIVNYQNITTSDINYKLIFTSDSKDLFISDNEYIYKIGDIIFYNKEYDINLIDTPTNNIYPNKLYYNLTTSNTYLSLISKLDNSTIFNSIGVFSDFSKKININELNIGYHNSNNNENINLFNLSFNLTTSKLNLNTTNSLYEFNILNFNEFIYGYEKTEVDNKKSIVNIFSFKKDYSNINTINLNLNYNTSIINGSLYKTFIKTDNPDKISMSTFMKNDGSHQNFDFMFETSKQAIPYIINKNNKLIAYYEIDNNKLSNELRKNFMNQTSNTSDYNVMDILTFLMLKIYYLENK